VDQDGLSTYNGTLEGVGTFQKDGSGTLVLAGPNTYTGSTTVQSGELRVNGALAQTTVTVNGDGVLSGTGVIQGSVNVQQQGTIIPGGGIGKLAIAGALLLGNESRTSIQVDAALGLASGIYQIGHVTYGGTLIVQSRSGTLSLGQSFHVFSAAQATGQFSAIVPGPGPGLRWTFSPLTGVLSVAPLPELRIQTTQHNTLTITWLVTAFHLQAQTNSLMVGLSGNWFDYPGGATSPVIIPANPANECWFFRLASP
jgi:autotransporter-associated beta strand protein